MITKEEIEDLGWISKESPYGGIYPMWVIDNYELGVNMRNNTITILKVSPGFEFDRVKFEGRIITKSELEFVMKLTMYETI